MGINSRAKGNKGERTVAALFKKWTGKEFARTPSSGGLQWKTSNTKGDIVCTTEGHYFPFCVEVKVHKEIDFSHLLIPGIKNVKILEFWEQCKREAKKCNKIPMLLMRYDRMPKDFFFIVIPQPFAKLIHDKFEGNIASLRFHDYTKDDPIMILRSTDLFSTHYKAIKQIAKTYIKNG